MKLYLVLLVLLDDHPLGYGKECDAGYIYYRGADG